ncbi:uncharacterized protein F5147DRAFT_773784 [Suillus discolor]|uniref:Uncharacterized protein n=1 Tax=Suillus discolor TaxID=1912936 RepID=A0A9P7JU05_9AGAM|nr:uncharacterized protein F5147DRAFT_773784 [Suillus discolor]KAG2108203.1 hypothetical protein F5147DRAFT_773784 [Suillus discolor]
MCGGGFEHKHLTNGIIFELLKSIQNVLHAPETTDNAQTVVSDKGSPQASKLWTLLLEVKHLDLNISAASSMHIYHGSKLKYGDKHGNNQTSAPIAGTGMVLSDIDAEGEQSDSTCISNVFELREDAKKSTKGHKVNHDSNDGLAANESLAHLPKGKGKGKKKAFKPTLPQTEESDDELDANESAMAIVKEKINLTVVDRVLARDSPNDELQPLACNESDVEQSAILLGKGNSTPASQMSLLATDNDDKYQHISADLEILRRAARLVNPHSLPSILDDWSKWNRIAFEQGNLQVFLKLGTWMLLRFRQLAMLDMDTDVNGVIIPENPRTMAFDSEDQYLEALGMEHLYSAIVHMESRLCFLSHLFHSLGNVANDSDIRESNPRFWSIASPPPVTHSNRSVRRSPKRGVVH